MELFCEVGSFLLKLFRLGDGDWFSLMERHDVGGGNFFLHLLERFLSVSVSCETAVIVFK